MYPELVKEIVVAIISIAYGVVSAVSGGGGGLFLVPAMVATFTIPYNVLIGSVFVVYLVASLSGLITYARKGLVDYKIGALLAFPTVPGVIIGTFLETSISAFEFKFGLGLITIILSLALYRSQSSTQGVRERIKMQGDDQASNLTSHSQDSRSRVITDNSGRTFTYSPRLLMGALLNFSAGLLSGTFGAGAAILIVPAMIMFVKMPGHVAIASSRIVLLALNVGAVVTHVSMGAIDYFYALVLSVGAVIGIYLGAKLVFKMSPFLLTRIMAVIFVMLGAYLIFASL